MKHVVTLAFLAVGLALASAPVAGVVSQEPSLETIMQRKLDHAHALLEALITEDFETLEDSASALQELSRRSAWFALQTSEYNERSTAFQRAVEGIETAARARSLEGAALGYVDMTLKCVQCHQYLRGVGRADASRFPVEGVETPSLGPDARHGRAGR